MGLVVMRAQAVTFIWTVCSLKGWLASIFQAFEFGYDQTPFDYNTIDQPAIGLIRS